MNPKAPQTHPRLSWGVILEGLWLPVLFWTVAVLVVASSERTEIALWTPAAWLLALPVGLRIGNRSPNSRTRLVGIEAAVSGGCLGLWLGGLSLLTVRINLPYQIGTGLIGIIACAGLAVLAARRRKPE